MIFSEALSFSPRVLINGVGFVGKSILQSLVCSKIACAMRFILEVVIIV